MKLIVEHFKNQLCKDCDSGSRCISFTCPITSSLHIFMLLQLCSQTSRDRNQHKKLNGINAINVEIIDFIVHKLICSLVYEFRPHRFSLVMSLVILRRKNKTFNRHTYIRNVKHLLRLSSVNQRPGIPAMCANTFRRIPSRC